MSFLGDCSAKALKLIKHTGCSNEAPKTKQGKQENYGELWMSMEQFFWFTLLLRRGKLRGKQIVFFKICKTETILYVRYVSTIL